MNVPSRAGGPPPAAIGPAQRVAAAAATGFLLVAPFAGSAGLRATALILCALALAWAWRRAAVPGWGMLPRALSVAWLAWAALAVASLAWSVDPRYTFGELRAQVFYGLLALAGFYFVADARRWRIGAVALLLGAGLAFAAQELQALLPIPMSRHPVDGGAGPWSTHLVLLAPTLLALAWPAPWGLRLHAAWVGLAVSLLLVAAWDSGNRIVWPAFALQLAVVAALWGHMPAHGGMKPATLRRLLLAGAVTLALAFVAAVADRNERHFAAQPLTTHLERDLRPAIWKTAWDLVGEAPWLGHGFGREIRAADFSALAPDPSYPEIRHAHNVFLDQWLQLGAIGLGAFVLVLVLLGREYVAMLSNPAAAPWAVVGLAILAGFLAKCLTDDFLHRHNATVFWALNGMLLGLGRRAR